MRVDGWDERLCAVIAQQTAGDFVFGSRDCATLFAAVVEAQTGYDPLGAFRPWGSEADAARMLIRAGVRSMHEFVARHFDEIVPADARRGDVGFSADPAPLSSPLVIVGEHAIGRSAAGLVRVPRAAIASAFKVG